jgi:hypothetical protein
MKSIVLACAVGACALTGLSGCVIPAGSSRVNSSHFVYPNSNVTAGQKTHGGATRLCGILFFSWNGFTPSATEDAYRSAIERTSGDLLINASESRSQLILPLGMILPLFSLCMTDVEGTAARMEVGKQELH